MAGLNRGFLVGRDDELFDSKWFTFPLAGVQVQHAAGFGFEIGITGEDPGAVAPRPDGIGSEPSPNRGAGDLGDEATVEHLSADIWDVQPRQRQAETLREFARNRLDFDDDLRGEKPQGDHAVGVPRAQRVALRRIACATSTRSLGGNPDALQSHRCRIPGQRARRSWLASHLYTATYSGAPVA
jgi:hypothetical protein